MSATDGFFRQQDGRYDPLPAAMSGWGVDHVRGPAITGLLGRAAEHECPADDRRPARASFELFRPARMVPSTTRATVVRSGRRLTLVDTELVQDGTVVARAHVLFLATADEPSGRIWTPTLDVRPPAAGTPGDDEGRIYLSGRSWTSRAEDHHNDHPKSVWQQPLPVIEGETPSPFQTVAAASDITSLVVHWGDRGVEFINADASIVLSRPPTPGGVGLSAIQRSTDSGISAGAAVLFDGQGALGSSSVTAVANARNAVMPGDHLAAVPRGR